MLKRDCYWYHCEHQMGASIDCCTLASGLGDCPCSDDCHNYITNEEVTRILKRLKTQEHEGDWISRKRLRDEIQYYIEEAGWGDEVNKVLGWCLEFIDNQEAVKWDV